MDLVRLGPVPPLVWNENLYAAAYEHSFDLANSDTFSHIGSGTQYDITGLENGYASHYDERIKANGYEKYKAIGENIAGGQESIDEVIEAWLNSSEHCSNLMNEKYKDVGVAIVINPNSQYMIYWTQNFGAK